MIGFSAYGEEDMPRCRPFAFKAPGRTKRLSLVPLALALHMEAIQRNSHTKLDDTVHDYLGWLLIPLYVFRLTCLALGRQR